MVRQLPDGTILYDVYLHLPIEKTVLIAGIPNYNRIFSVGAVFSKQHLYNLVDKDLVVAEVSEDHTEVWLEYNE